MKEACKAYYEMMEKTIGQMAKEIQEDIYYPQAVECAKGFVLDEQRRISEACKGDMDLMCEKFPRNMS